MRETSTKTSVSELWGNRDGDDGPGPYFFIQSRAGNEYIHPKDLIWTFKNNQKKPKLSGLGPAPSPSSGGILRKRNPFVIWSIYSLTNPI